MSRAEKTPIPIAAGVSVSVDGATVSVSGANGKISQKFSDDVKIMLDGSNLHVKTANGSRQAAAMAGTAKAIVRNMISGVVAPFSKQLEIAGVGFKAVLSGADVLELSLGTSHPISYALPKGVTVAVADGVRLTVTGIDRQKVGQVAADIFAFSPMEPYKGKGVRIVGKFVRRKEGKKAA